MKKKILLREEILHLAELSALHLKEEEINKYWKQLEETVEYVRNLEELDTKRLSATSHVTNLNNVFFNDGEEDSRQLTQNEALANAKNKKDGLFVVKRIM